jgi:hypothetical protein
LPLELTQLLREYARGLGITEHAIIFILSFVFYLRPQELDYATLRWLRDVRSYPHLPSVLESPLKLKAEISFDPPRPRSDRLWDEQKIKRAISNVCRGC